MGEFRMIYIFPETKFVRENNNKKQQVHVASEWREFMDTKWNTEEEREEAMDLYHSLETLFRIWERDGVDMEAVRQKVIKKNRERGYYHTEGEK